MVPVRTFKFGLAYNGAGFAGWAQQPHARTVEGVLTAEVRRVVPDLRRIMVGGRTDRGVHATGQVISFPARTGLSPSVLADVMNEAAPRELVVTSAENVASSFHARFSARSRAYVYTMPCDRPDVLARRIRPMLQALRGRRDFYAFARDTPRGARTTRSLSHAEVRAEQGALRFDLEADGFLRRQVRVLVSTALREAQLEAPDDILVRLAASMDRRATAPAAPPEHLTLVAVRYDPTPRGPAARGSKL